MTPHNAAKCPVCQERRGRCPYYTAGRSEQPDNCLLRAWDDAMDEVERIESEARGDE